MSEPEQQPRTADDLGHFFKSLLKNPLSIGAVAPSGRFLARLMATTLEPGARVIELGAGTGTVTQAILDAGVEPTDLYLVEQDARFVRVLARRFPQCRIIAADATSLCEHVGASRGSFDFVVSSLPLLLFSPERKLKLMAQIFELLRPNGVLHQFTYGGRCPVDRELRGKLGLERSLIGIAPFNLPPAFVYRLERA